MAQSSGKDQPVRLWGGRFTGATDPLMDQYNESLSVDRVFYSQDIRGSIAYARANVKTGILTQEEFETIESGLQTISKEWTEGKFKPAPGDEGRPGLIQFKSLYKNQLLREKQTFILRTSAVSVKSSERTLQGSYTQAAVVMTKLQQICVCGCVMN